MYILWWRYQITQLLLNNIYTFLSLDLICSIVVGECGYPFPLTVKVKNYNFGADTDGGKNDTGADADDDDDDDDGKGDSGVRDMLLVSGDYH